MPSPPRNVLPSKGAPYTTPITRKTPPRLCKNNNTQSSLIPSQSNASSNKSVSSILCASQSKTSLTSDVTDNHPVASSYSDDEDDTISKSTGTLVQTINFELITCEEYYNNSGKNKAVLMAMARGVPSCLYDTNKEPFKSSKNRRSFIPKDKELLDEIIRRANASGMTGSKLPRPKGWTREKKLEWLDNNNILQLEDRMFITQQVAALVIGDIQSTLQRNGKNIRITFFWYVNIGVIDAKVVKFA
jgi:hypothetical protein